MEFVEILPNLGVGVSAVAAMYLTYKLNAQQNKEKDAIMLAELKEREVNFRALEKEVRENITHALNESTRALTDSNLTMRRVLDRLDSPTLPHQAQTNVVIKNEAQPPVQ